MSFKRIYSPKEIIRPYMSYSGNKRKLMPLLLSLIPGRRRTFVDLFGGTGAVGVNACLLRGAKSLVYNDYEFDMAYMMDYFHTVPSARIVEEQEAVRVKYFGDCVYLGPDTLEAYYRLREDFNSSCQPCYLSPYFFGWRPMGEEGRRFPKYITESTHEALPSFAFTPSLVKASQLDHRMGDPALMLFLLRTALKCSPKWNNKGEYNGTPNFATEGHHSKRLDNYDVLRAYADAVYSIHDLQVFSCDSTTAFIPGAAVYRLRADSEVAAFRAVLHELGPSDMVYIDPPYLDSGASYNKSWGYRMEVFLLTCCEVLDDHKVPFILSNNLFFDTSLLREWSHHFKCYVCDVNYSSMSKKHAGKPKCEVFVTNCPAYSSKVPLHAKLTPVPAGEDALAFFMEEVVSKARDSVAV